MIKESKYIIKRILIGVGIVLVLGFIKSAKASALTWDDMDSVVSFKIKPTQGYNTIYYDSIDDRYYFKTIVKNNYDTYLDNASFYPYFLCYQGSSYNGNNWASLEGSSNNTEAICIFSDVDLYYIWYGDFGGDSSSRYWINPNKTIHYAYFWVNSSLSTTSINVGTSTVSSETIGGKSYNFSKISSLYSRNSIFASNYDTKNYKDNSIYFKKNISFSPFIIPSIDSLQPTKITNNNVTTGYIFRPKFTNFNTDSYVYQYKVGKNSTRWLSLTENEQQIKINNNIDLYVRIKDKNTNDIIDSVTFTITDIGSFDTKQDYNITFSGEYRTENYLNNNTSSKSQSKIKEYQIYVDYTPKTSILKYQYQYVKDGESLNNDNWKTLASSNNGSFTYVASENGTLYARILDSSDNILYSATFTINNIGLLAIDSNERNVDNFFTKLSNKINYGGPVSSLFVIPVNTLNSLYSSMSNSNSCSPIQLGSLLGTNLKYDCINFKSIVGNEVYNIIDVIFAFVLTIGVFKFILKLYNDFISMKEV